MNKNVAATCPDLGPVFKIANLLTHPVGDFGWLEGGGGGGVPRNTTTCLHAKVNTDQKNPTCMTTTQARSGTLSWCELQA
jgi:hypothetical protein